MEHKLYEATINVNYGMLNDYVKGEDFRWAVIIMFTFISENVYL